MNQNTYCELISNKIKLVRVENDYTQQNVADLLGISKKSLVQIEKRRKPVSWTVAIAFSTLFRDSQVLLDALGDDPIEIIDLITKDEKISRPAKSKTLGGKLWWRDITSEKHLTLQQNVISQHYRVIDEDNFRLFSTFNLEEAEQFISD